MCVREELLHSRRGGPLSPSNTLFMSRAHFANDSWTYRNAARLTYLVSMLHSHSNGHWMHHRQNLITAVCSALTSGLCLSLAIRPSSSSTRSSLLSCPKERMSAVQQVYKMLLLERLRCLFASPQDIYWVISVNVNIHTHLSIWWAGGPGDCLCPEPAAGFSFPERLGSTTENTEHNIRYCWG